MKETLLYQFCIDDNDNKLYIKRDDLLPFSFGGNKARKAINFFNEIDSGDYDCVVTYGSSSSNHCRIVSNMAASRNMPCYIISPKEASSPTFNSEMMNLFDAEFIVVPVSEVHDTIENTLLQLRDEGRIPYFIQGGGHGNLGTQAYVDCYNEIKNYETNENVSFDYIFFATGTGTTQAGLVCGKLINNDETKIIGISIARKNPSGRQIVIESVNDYLKENNITFSQSIVDESVIFVDNYTENGYANYSDDISATIDNILINYGISLDSTYTGKAYRGMLRYIEENKINNKNILFIHTGGTPLFFDYLKEK